MKELILEDKITLVKRHFRLWKDKPPKDIETQIKLAKTALKSCSPHSKKAIPYRQKFESIIIALELAREETESTEPESNFEVLEPKTALPPAEYPPGKMSAGWIRDNFKEKDSGDAE